ncbi:hypothetical protein [Syntrophorhabdus aromaticivorans]|uniref:hypothetical protein n=1 Tax=Syntrophorhabdus aromaticivorans TaxID=328301 RepID=UPI0003FE4446|nr:hypothetical protein [Syntrophorhabdus aromaticivorans]
MKKYVFLAILTIFICSCGKGPIHVATTESEAVKRGYGDPKLQELYDQNETLLREIYLRFTKANVNIYKEGIGLSLLTDRQNDKLHYIMVNIRPQEIVFDESKSKPEQRFSQVLQTYVRKYVGYMKKEDIDRPDIEGLAFGVYWPVRDYSQCNTHGGFIEYIHVYMPTAEVYDLLDGRSTFEEAIGNSEVVTSLNLDKATSVKPVF